MNNRIGYIDSFRGIASVLVVLHHLSCVFLPGLYNAERANTSFEVMWLNTPLNLLTNGNVAVQCFFVLSGFLLTRKVYLSGNAKNTPLTEYKKLLRVVVPGVLLSALLMITGLMFHLKAAENNSILSFVNSFNAFTPTIKSVLFDCFIRPFYYNSIYVSPFWTIVYEFFGALLITIISYYAYSHKHSKLIYLFFVVAMLLLSIKNEMYGIRNFVSFFLGAISYDCAEKEDNSILGKTLVYITGKRVFRIVLLGIGTYLLCVNNSMSGIWTWINHFYLLRYNCELVRAIGIAIVLLVVSKSPLLQKIFSIRPLIWLGSISAYTYAFHWQMILSVGCGLFLLLSDSLNYYLTVAIVSIAVFATTFILSYLYILLVKKSKLLISYRLSKSKASR